MPNVEQYYKLTYRQRYKCSLRPQRRHVLRAARCALHRFKRIAPELKQMGRSQLRTLDEFVDFLRRLYNRDVREDDTVTVIHFSEIR